MDVQGPASLKTTFCLFLWSPSSCGHGAYLETSPKRLPLMMKGTSTWGLRGQGRCLRKPHPPPWSLTQARCPAKANIPSGQPAQSSTLSPQPEARAPTTPRCTTPWPVSLGFEKTHTLTLSGPHDTPHVAAEANRAQREGDFPHLVCPWGDQEKWGKARPSRSPEGWIPWLPPGPPRTQSAFLLWSSPLSSPPLPA